MANVLIEDSFLIKLERIKGEIRANFYRILQVLQKREEELLSELQQLGERYKGGAVTKQIEELNHLKQMHLSAVKRNENKEFVMQKVSEFDSRVKEIREAFEREKRQIKRVSLEWDEEVEKKIVEIGRINVNSVPDYKEKEYPVIVACKNGTQISELPGVFHFPRSISIEAETDKVFICDLGNHRIQVFNESLEFLTEFNEKMSGPYGVCVYQSKVYVTQHSGHRLNVYTTEGSYLKSVGNYGKNGLEFNCPKGVAIQTDTIYVCDYENNRIQCLNLDLTLNLIIQDIPGPRDVKLTIDEIVMLTQGELCICFYNKSYQKIREVIPSGEGKQVIMPYMFCLDSEQNILLIDNSNNSVVIFTKNGDLIHKFGKGGEGRGEFIHPVGIALNSDNRIIVTSRNPENCVQLF